MYPIRPPEPIGTVASYESDAKVQKALRSLACVIAPDTAVHEIAGRHPGRGAFACMCGAIVGAFTTLVLELLGLVVSLVFGPALVLCGTMLGAAAGFLVGALADAARRPRHPGATARLDASRDDVMAPASVVEERRRLVGGGRLFPFTPGTVRSLRTVRAPSNRGPASERTRATSSRLLRPPGGLSAIAPIRSRAALTRVARRAPAIPRQQ